MERRSNKAVIFLILGNVFLLCAIVMVGASMLMNQSRREEDNENLDEIHSDESDYESEPTDQTPDNETEEEPSAETGVTEEASSTDSTRDEAYEAYMAFLNGDRPAIYVERDNKKYYVDQIIEMKEHYSEEVRAEYCFIETSGDFQHLGMALRSGDFDREHEYFTDCWCYVFCYKEGEIYLHYEFMEEYMHGSGKINCMGVIRKEESSLSMGFNTSERFIVNGETVQIYQCSGFDFENVKFPGVTVPEAFKNSTDDFECSLGRAYEAYERIYGEFDLDCSFEEYLIQEEKYYACVFKNDRSEREEAFLEFCGEEGIFFHSSEQIEEKIAEMRAEYASREVFEAPEPEWVFLK